MGLERGRRTLCWIAASGALLGVVGELVIRLGWRDPRTVELLQEISAGLNVGALVALALGALGLAMASRSAWWMAAAVGLGLRCSMACVELLVFDPQAGPPSAGLMAMAGLTVLGAWGCLGLATLVRRRDGQAAVGAVAGILIGLMAIAFLGTYLGFSSAEPVASHQIVLLDLGQALSLVGVPLLAAFFLSAAASPRGDPPAKTQSAMRTWAAGGAILMGIGLGAIIYAAPVGWMASEATALVGLILGCAGLALFGCAPLALRPGGLSWLLAGLVWAAVAAIIAVVVFDTSRPVAWAAAGLSSLAMIGCGAILLGARDPSPRLGGLAGGLLILSSAVGMTWAVLGLSDALFELREVIRMLTLFGFLAGLCLATLALLAGARWPGSGLAREGTGGSP